MAEYNEDFREAAWPARIALSAAITGGTYQL